MCGGVPALAMPVLICCACRLRSLLKKIVEAKKFLGGNMKTAFFSLAEVYYAAGEDIKCVATRALPIHALPQTVLHDLSYHTGTLFWKAPPPQQSRFR